ncbi:MAG: hypothetical protein ERJ69_05335 [Aphanocapsa feldmannii 288cV]|nr:MAG: hypothetical protein ERJ69_05335 [Aphanocapsa feldmannii 288cV]
MVKGEQAQGVAHQDAHPAGLEATAMAQSPHHQGECSQPEVGLRFAATCGEEEQIDNVALPMGIGRSGDTDEIHQHESQLERPPAGNDPTRIFALHHAEALASGLCHHAIRDRKGLANVVFCKRIDAALDAPGLVPGIFEQLPASLPLLRVEIRRGFLPGDPLLVGGDQWGEGGLNGLCA